MTEDQVKQIVANMIGSGELEVDIKHTFDPFLNKNQVAVNIFHNKEDGYRKKLLSKSMRL